MPHVGDRGQLEGVFSVHYMGPRDQTRVMRLGSKHLYLVSHLSGPKGAFKPGMVTQIYDPSTCEVEAGGEGVEGHPRLYN